MHRPRNFRINTHEMNYKDCQGTKLHCLVMKVQNVTEQLKRSTESQGQNRVTGMCLQFLLCNPISVTPDALSIFQRCIIDFVT